MSDYEDTGRVSVYLIVGLSGFARVRLYGHTITKDARLEGSKCATLPPNSPVMPVDPIRSH